MERNQPKNYNHGKLSSIASQRWPLVAKTLTLTSCKTFDLDLWPCPQLKQVLCQNRHDDKTRFVTAWPWSSASTYNLNLAKVKVDPYIQNQCKRWMRRYQIQYLINYKRNRPLHEALDRESVPPDYRQTHRDLGLYSTCHGNLMLHSTSRALISTTMRHAHCVKCIADSA